MLPWAMSQLCGERGAHSGRLRKMTRTDRSSAQAITRAGILLKIDEGRTTHQVPVALEALERTVFHIKHWFVKEELEEVPRHHRSFTGIDLSRPPLVKWFQVNSYSIQWSHTTLSSQSGEAQQPRL